MFLRKNSAHLEVSLTYDQAGLTLHKTSVLPNKWRISFSMSNPRIIRNIYGCKGYENLDLIEQYHYSLIRVNHLSQLRMCP